MLVILWQLCAVRWILVMAVVAVPFYDVSRIGRGGENGLMQEVLFLDRASFVSQDGLFGEGRRKKGSSKGGGRSLRRAKDLFLLPVRAVRM